MTLIFVQILNGEKRYRIYQPHYFLFIFFFFFIKLSKSWWKSRNGFFFYEMVGHTRLSQIRITRTNNYYLLRLFRNYGRLPMWSSSVFHDQFVVLCLFWFANYVMTSTTNVFEEGPQSVLSVS